MVLSIKRLFKQVAVEGCCHGELDAIYNHIQQLEKRNSYKIDLLLICGDFQAVRNHQDLQCMAVPDKYKHIQNFYKWSRPCIHLCSGFWLSSTLILKVLHWRKAGATLNDCDWRESWSFELHVGIVSRLFPKIWSTDLYQAKVSWRMVGSEDIFFRLCRVRTGRRSKDRWCVWYF